MAESKNTKAVDMKTVWSDLSKIDVKSFVEEKTSGRRNPDGSEHMLKYLNWARTFSEVSQYDPDWVKRVVEFNSDGIEVAEDQHGYPYQKIFGGFLVVTEVTIKGNTRRMWLQVMDERNKSMKEHPYKVVTKYGKTLTVLPMDSNALNTTIMRCFVKNISTNFGLGWKIYAGEDLGEDDVEEIIETPSPIEAPSTVANVNEVTGEVEEYDIPIEDVPVPNVAHVDADVVPVVEEPSMSFEEALTHCFINGGSGLQGTPVLKLVTHSIDANKSMKILNKFAETGKGKDKEACQLIINALGSGKLKFPDPEQVKQIKEAAAV